MITKLIKSSAKGFMAMIVAMVIATFSSEIHGQFWWGASYSPAYQWGPSGYWSPGISIGSGGVSFSLNIGSGYNPVYYNPGPGYVNPIYYNPPLVSYPTPAPPVVAAPITPPPRQPAYNFPNGNGWSLTPGRLPSPGRM